MRSVAVDVFRTVVPSEGDPHGPLPPILILLTVVTGVVDAVSYLKLGHVFVANMTGNVVFLGFAAAGAGDISAPNSVLAMLAFLVAGVAGGRLARRFVRHRGYLLAATTAIQLVFLVLALAVALVSFGDLARVLLVVLLALAMGLQNAAARSVGVPDLMTTVLTMTLTGLAADSALAGGTSPRSGRRILSIVAMFVGALLGGLLVLKVSVAAALGLAALLLTAVCLGIRWASRPDAAWARAAT